MNQLIAAELHGDILSPREVVRVVGMTHALHGRVDQHVPAGLSIAEILEEVVPEVQHSGLLVNLVNDESIAPVLEQNWHRVRVKVGTTVSFRPRMQGGGTLRSVLGIVLAVAALVVAPWAASFITIAGMALAGGTATLVTGLIGAGIMFAGTLALNALFPVRPAQLSNESGASQALNSIQGARNSATPFEVVPVVLGTHRQSPPYAAKPYTELLGDEQWLRVIFCLGYGPLAISDIKIGETPLSSFTDYGLEQLNGYPGDPAPTQYPSQVNEQPLAITLHNVDGFQSVFTPADTDAISVDIAAPEGIYEINGESGNLDAYSVTVDFEIRPVGSGPFAPFATLTFGRTVKPARLGTYATLGRGQFEVRARKVTNDHPSEKVMDTVAWTALRSFRHESPIRFPKPLALISLRIKATDQLNGVIDTLNCVTTSLVTAFNGSGWDQNTASQWPSDLFRHTLQGPANARPVPDSLIAIDNLEEWWAYCVANGLKFNQIRTQRASVYDTVADIAAAGRAVPTFIDGKWGVVWDRPDATVVNHFTPVNSWGFQLGRAYAQLPHGWRVRFINELNGFTQDERIVYDDGYDQNNATLFEGIEFPGVTDPALNWKHGRYHIAQSRLRPETFTLSTAWENAILTRGDRVRVTHDVALIGSGFGHVKSVSGQFVDVDEVLTIESGKNYGLRFRVPDDIREVLVAVVPTPAGEYTQLEVLGDLSLITEGTLFAFGETQRESAVYRVKTITHQRNLVATLVLVDDAPAISMADQGEIPDYNPNVTLPPDPFTMPPQDLRYVEQILGFGPNATVGVQLSWTMPRRGRVVAFEIQQRDDNGFAQWVRVEVVSYPTTTYSIPLISDGIWSYRVRCIFNDDTFSDWATLPTLNLQGLLAPPATVLNFRETFTAGRLWLTWDSLPDNRGILYEIRKGESWDAALIVGEAIAQPKYQTVGDDTYWIAAYVITAFGLKIYSNQKQSLTLSKSVLVENVVIERNEQSVSWDGHRGGSLGVDFDATPLGYLRTSGGDFIGLGDFLGTGSILNAGGQSGGIYMSRIIVDAGRIMPCRVSVDYEATAVPEDDDFLGDPSLLDNPDFLKSFLTEYIRVYPIVRLGEADDPNAFGSSDIFDELDAFKAGINWGEWRKWSPDVYLGRFYHLGLAFEILDTSRGAIAYGLKFNWVVDVPDRLDRYQGLIVPPGGFEIAFKPTGSALPVPFNGGINNQALPHILEGYVDKPPGYQIVIENLTLAGCTVKVRNGSGDDVGGVGVNIMAQGY